MEKLPKHKQTMVDSLRAVMTGDLKTAKRLLKKAHKQVDEYYNYSQHIGSYLNQMIGSDITPVGKIIKAEGTKLTLNPVEHKLVTKMDFHIGGFMANCSNNDEQEYSYTVDETKEFQITITKSMLKNQYYFSDKPKYYYDYNF